MIGSADYNIVGLPRGLMINRTPNRVGTSTSKSRRANHKFQLVGEKKADLSQQWKKHPAMEVPPELKRERLKTKIFQKRQEMST